MWKDLLSAVALVLVLEGIMPFVMPKAWRSFIVKISNNNDKTVRIMGFILMLVGLLLLYVVKSNYLPI